MRSVGFLLFLCVSLCLTVCYQSSVYIIHLNAKLTISHGAFLGREKVNRLISFSLPLTAFVPHSVESNSLGPSILHGGAFVLV